MHGGGSGSGGKKSARIEIIPLIDVIFFLLATFVLFTISLNKSMGIPVHLPTAVSGEARDPSGCVTISVTTEGTIAWDKEEITLGEFITRLPLFKREEPDGRILINGDKDAYYSQAIYVFDEARKAGFTKIFIETQARSN